MLNFISYDLSCQTEKVDHLLFSVKLDSALNLLQAGKISESIVCAKSIQDRIDHSDSASYRLLVRVYDIIGRASYNQMEFDASKKFLDSCVYYTKIVFGENSSEYRMNFINSMRAAIKMHQYDKAIKGGNEIIASCKKSKDYDKIIAAYGLLIEAYQNEKQFYEIEECINSANEVLGKFFINAKDRYRYYAILFNYYRKSDLHNLAVLAIDSAIAIANELNEHLKIDETINNKANLFFDMGDFNQAEIYYLDYIGRVGENNLRYLNALRQYGMIQFLRKDYFLADSVFNLILNYISLNKADTKQENAYLQCFSWASCHYLENSISWKNNSKIKLGIKRIDSIMNLEVKNTFNEELMQTLKLSQFMYAAISKSERAKDYLNELVQYKKVQFDQKIAMLSEAESRSFLSVEKVNDLNLLFQFHDDSLFSINMKKLLCEVAVNLKNVDLNNNSNFNRYLHTVSDSMNMAYKDLRDKYYDDLNSSNITQRNRDLKMLELHEKEILRSPKYLSFRKKVLFNFDSLRSSLKDGELVIDFFRHNGKFNIKDTSFSSNVHYIAIAIHKDYSYPLIFNIADEQELIKVINKKSAVGLSNNSMLSSRGKSFGLVPRKNNIKSLYELLIKPIVSEFDSVSTIYFSTTGVLNSVNLRAIKTNGANYLMDEYSLVQFLSISRILEYKKRINESVGSALLVGGVDYGISKFDKQDQDWNYLNSTKDEINEINQLLLDHKVNNVSLLEGMNASERSVSELLHHANSPSIIHIATHGYFNNNVASTNSYSYDPLVNNGLVLAGVNSYDSTLNNRLNDGYYTSREIVRLDLFNTRFVALTACLSGLGDYLNNNESYYGLMRAFYIAGVQSALVSLWSVPDLATKELIVEFYNYWFNQKINPNVALSLAQQKLRKKYEDPYNWSGFILVN